MIYKNPFCVAVLLVVVLVGGLCVLSAEPAHSPALAQATGGAQGGQTPARAEGPTPAQSSAPSEPNAAAGRPPVWQGSTINRLSGRAEMYYDAA